MPASYKVGRSGPTVTVTIHVPKAETAFAFNINAGSDFAAALLVEAMVRDLCDRLAAIRRNAYALGWKDARAKRPKRVHFGGCINSEGGDC